MNLQLNLADRGDFGGLIGSPTPLSMDVIRATAELVTRLGDVASGLRYEETDWRGIVALYELLVRVKPTPIVALNRAIALGQVEGPESGLAAMRAIPEDRLAGYPFFAAALGEMHRRAGRPDEAAKHYRAAIDQSRSPIEAGVFRQRLASCDPRGPERVERK